MLTTIFFLALIYVAWKMFVFGLKATRRIMKILCTVLLLPAFLVGLVCVGLIYVAVPILIIAGITVIIGGATSV